MKTIAIPAESVREFLESEPVAERLRGNRLRLPDCFFPIDERLSLYFDEQSLESYLHSVSGEHQYHPLSLGVSAETLRMDRVFVALHLAVRAVSSPSSSKTGATASP